MIFTVLSFYLYFWEFFFIAFYSLTCGLFRFVSFCDLLCLFPPRSHMCPLLLHVSLFTAMPKNNENARKGKERTRAIATRRNSKNNAGKWAIKQNIVVDNQIITTNSLQKRKMAVAGARWVSGGTGMTTDVARRITGRSQ